MKNAKEELIELLGIIEGDAKYMKELVEEDDFELLDELLCIVIYRAETAKDLYYRILEEKGIE